MGILIFIISNVAGFFHCFLLVFQENVQNGFESGAKLLCFFNGAEGVGWGRRLGRRLSTVKGKQGQNARQMDALSGIFFPNFPAGGKNRYTNGIFCVILCTQAFRQQIFRRHPATPLTGRFSLYLACVRTRNHRWAGCRLRYAAVLPKSNKGCKQALSRGKRRDGVFFAESWLPCFVAPKFHGRILHISTKGVYIHWLND